MRQSRDEQRPQRCSTKVLRGECAVSDARSGCSSEETGDEVELLEAEVIDPEDEVKFLAETRKMLANNDSRLKYVLGGDAIENPFAVDRETQLSYLMSLFCEKKADGGYECIACIEEHNDLDEMHGHLLRHSNSKFYLLQLDEIASLQSRSRAGSMVHADETNPTSSMSQKSATMGAMLGTSIKPRERRRRHAGFGLSSVLRNTHLELLKCEIASLPAKHLHPVILATGVTPVPERRYHIGSVAQLAYEEHQKTGECKWTQTMRSLL
ncbi:hypothetical protein TcWFU_005345 [Taenia crassiceps]|uniref:C2H2-type domain-containing protein n=2 Tax=Taenia crassiceps TaxID=6207 RepID=A0ABR4PZ89_9CEST